MKLWLSKEEPYLKDEDIIWVKNSWDALKIIDESNAQIGEAFRYPYDLEESLELMSQASIEYISLDCIPESLKFIEGLFKRKYNKYYRFCIINKREYFYEELQKILFNETDLAFTLLSKPY